MCNLIRYKEEMEELYGNFEEFSHIRMVPKFRFRVAPSEPAPVLTMNNGQAQIDMMRFGFRMGKGRQLMARGETAAELRSFKDAFKGRRCLVLAHGFFDSEDMGGYRQPWHLHLKGDGLMAFAGLWEPGGEMNNFTIVSAPANAVVARVIDRMPVILRPAAWRGWLDASATREELQPFLAPYDPAMMEAYPVTRKVNKPGYDAPDCVEPITVAQGDLGIF